MKNKKYLTKKRRMNIVMIKTTVLFTAIFFSQYAIYSAGIGAEWGQIHDYNIESHNLVMRKHQELREEHRAENAKLEQYNEILSTMGQMGKEIKKASIEFGDNNDEAVVLMGLSIGIANAESTLGQNFVYEYDKDNCFNWWGIKRMRADGSSLRCFNDERAGARTMASLLKRLYIREGLNTPEKMVYKYVGSKWTQYHDTWVNNVKKYF